MPSENQFFDNIAALPLAQEIKSPTLPSRAFDLTDAES
jgi:hypothetical protein